MLRQYWIIRSGKFWTLLRNQLLSITRISGLENFFPNFVWRKEVFLEANLWWMVVIVVGGVEDELGVGLGLGRDPNELDFADFLVSISKKHFWRVGRSGTRLKKLNSSELGTWFGFRSFLLNLLMPHVMMIHLFKTFTKIRGVKRPRELLAGYQQTMHIQAYELCKCAGSLT